MVFLLPTSIVPVLAGVGAVAVIGQATHHFKLDNWIDENVRPIIEKIGELIGRLVTLNLAKWKLTKGIWNSTVEPFLVIFLRSGVMAMTEGFVKGLLSDNQPAKV
ncbi:hypothetical protein JYU14_00950 [Simkania negevensis]|uniref:Uncharacterized protein n=1 Tax=Simkania negevensis TaxID=83561 RepID=A0ABS3AQR1_9BACT|nr:hypothetical protein [Simkania negevensis]